MADKDSEQIRVAMRGFSTVFGMFSVDDALRERLPPTKIVSFLYFKDPLDVEATRTMVRERLCAIQRFRCRVEPEVANSKRANTVFIEMPAAEFDEAFKTKVLVKHGIRTPADIDSFVSAVSSQPWDPDLPLWQCYILQNMADGRSMLMFVVDHSIADGVASVQTLMNIIDQPALGGKSPKLSVPSRKAVSSTPSCWTHMKGIFQAFWGPLIGDQLPADPQNRLKTKDFRNPGKSRAVCRTESLTLEQIRALRAVSPGSTINDVLMTLTALTLQEYFRRYEPSTLKQKVRGNFPINLRSVTGDDIMAEEHYGNRISQGQLRFPLDIEDPAAMMAAIRAQIDVIKVSPEPWVRDVLIQNLVLRSGLPVKMIADTVLAAFGKVTCMLSNVPGPMQPVHMMGQEVDDVDFYALGPIGLYFGIVQYKGLFKVGIACDTECEPEAWRLAECWPVAYAKLRGALVPSVVPSTA